MLYDRRYFEDHELKFLAPYAVKSKLSRGRRFPEELDTFRTGFQRDRDRIVHSKAFRRLKHKTQVFVIFEGDHFRTRLTHTLEVAQIARHMGRMMGLNEDLVETIALAHDLGHTPFGHAGEDALDVLLFDIGGFEHNEQSKRVVELLENKYPHFPGLNLSVEVLEGLMKHHTPFDHRENMLEHELVFPSLEAQIVNVADQLAYVSHDLDDGIASGILNMDDLVTHVDLWREAQLVTDSLYSDLNDQQTRFANVRYLINKMVNESVQFSESTRTRVGVETLDDVFSCRERIIGLSSELEAKIARLQLYLKERFYQDYRIVKMTLHGKQLINDLYNSFIKNSELLPKQEYDKILRGEEPRRIVADYIALMTDNYVTSEHSRLVLKDS
jgi:dGTPase